MTFNSVAFIVFMAIVWAAYHAMRGPMRRAWLLLGASYFFYMWWRVDYALLLVVSTAVDYVCGQVIGCSQRPLVRRAALATSVVVNVGLLLSFKYWNFLTESMVSLGACFGVGIDMPVFDVLLPIGISFYTFQTLSYTIEVFRGQIRPEPNLIRFALYVSFFPQLVAGPIERPGRLLPQIRAPREADADELVAGLRQILWGMFKKVVVADRLALYVDTVYGHPTDYGGGPLSVATVLFAVQIYCDFSAYSDIAIGCARTLGFDLMTNFRRPYLAWCPSDFWRRWHISLSTWFRDYVYIPLGGSRRGALRATAATMTVFLVCGLWHGANWTFVLWGGCHGIFVLAERAVRKVFALPRGADRLPAMSQIAGMAVTIPCVTAAWVFFRADSVSSAFYILGHLFSGLTWDGIACNLPPTYLPVSLALVAIVMGYDIGAEWGARSDKPTPWVIMPAPLRWCCYWSMASCILLIGQLTSTKQFIYFQF